MFEADLWAEINGQNVAGLTGARMRLGAHYAANAHFQDGKSFQAGAHGQRFESTGGTKRWPVAEKIANPKKWCNVALTLGTPASYGASHVSILAENLQNSINPDLFATSAADAPHGSAT